MKRRAYKLVKGPHGYDRIIPARGRLQRPEQAIQTAIFADVMPVMAAQYFREFMLFAVPNGGYRTPYESMILQKMGVMPGVADMILLLPGGKMKAYLENPDEIEGPVRLPDWLKLQVPPPRTVFIELKAIEPPPKPRIKKDGTPYKQRERKATGQEPSQKEFQKRVEFLGYEYVLLAATDPRDGIIKMRNILKSYGINGFQ